MSNTEDNERYEAQSDQDYVDYLEEIENYRLMKDGE